MNTVLSWTLRLVGLAAGLLFAASLVAVALVVILLWVIGAIWSRLTGRPVSPFVVRIDPRSGFNRMYRARGGSPFAQEPPAPSPSPRHGRLADVTDVEPKQARD